MAIDANGQSLDQLLEFREPLPAQAFVLEVMQRVRREQRRRSIILLVFGLVGAAFGLAGAFLLAGPVAGVFANLPVMATMRAVLIAAAALAFYVWSMHEDLGLSS